MDHFQLTIFEKKYLPGSDLKGEVEWSMDQRNETIEISLFWFTSGKGTQDIEIVEEQSFPTINTSGKKTFSFKLPQQPYSFSGKLITLTWAIEAKVKQKKIREEFEFIMSPTQTEVLLNNDSKV